MTNEMIILNERLRLMEEGIIKSTGRVLQFTDEEGEIHEYDEPEEIHTFAYWKNVENRIPKKGSKAIASFPIWCMKKIKNDTQDENDEKEDNNKDMFLKTSFFFTREQTEETK